MSSLIKLDRVSIVLVGDINPGIFRPDWFAKYQLVREDEAHDEAQIFLPKLTFLRLGPFEVTVQPKRFEAATTRPAHFSPLRDMVVGVLQLLSHTPIKSVGINRVMHYGGGRHGIWNRLAGLLSPASARMEVFRDSELALIKFRLERNDSIPGSTQVAIEQSPQVPNGIVVNSNDHFELSASDSDAVVDANAALELLDELFEGSIKRSKEVGDRVLGGIDE